MTLPPRHGVVAFTALDPAPGHACMPIAAVQGTLALDLGSSAAVRPHLRLMPGERAQLDRFAYRFAQAVIEVVAGDRGVQQLLRCTTEAVYEDLARRSAAVQRTTPRDQRVRQVRAQVRSVRLFCPTPTAAELSVHVLHGQRSRAFAARLEHLDGRWRCTALQFG
jgi:Family of unknown function (DUF6459)